MSEVKHVCDLCALGIPENKTCYVGVNKCLKNGVYTQFRNRETEQLERALDKACMQLERESMYKVDSDYYGKTSFFNKDSWKEWCLDES